MSDNFNLKRVKKGKKKRTKKSVGKSSISTNKTTSKTKKGTSKNPTTKTRKVGMKKSQSTSALANLRRNNVKKAVRSTTNRKGRVKRKNTKKTQKNIVWKDPRLKVGTKKVVKKKKLSMLEQFGKNRLLGKIKDDVLESVNKYRKLHNVEPLIWDEKCYQAARTLLVSKNFREKNITKKYGKTMLIQEMSKVTEKQQVDSKYLRNCVDFWYKGCRFYSFQPEVERREDDDFIAKYENYCEFTQLVWKESKKFGLSVIVEKDKTPFRVVIMACYYPKGNLNGKFDENVLKGKEKKE